MYKGVSHEFLAANDKKTKLLRLRHFFLYFPKTSDIIEYNAVGVGYSVRQQGLFTRPAI